MESEPLESCPICRGPVVLDGPSNPDASRDVVWPNCIDDACPYMLDGGIPAVVAEVHNTLARRAEIGALVERIVDSELDLAINSSHGPRTFYASTPESITGLSVDGWPSLLDALRALAAEIGGAR